MENLQVNKQIKLERRRVMIFEKRQEALMWKRINLILYAIYSLVLIYLVYIYIGLYELLKEHAIIEIIASYLEILLLFIVLIFLFLLIAMILYYLINCKLIKAYIGSFITIFVIVNVSLFFLISYFKYGYDDIIIQTHFYKVTYRYDTEQLLEILNKNSPRVNRWYTKEEKDLMFSKVKTMIDLKILLQDLVVEPNINWIEKVKRIIKGLNITINYEDVLMRICFVTLVVPVIIIICYYGTYTILYSVTHSLTDLSNFLDNYFKR